MNNPQNPNQPNRNNPNQPDTNQPYERNPGQNQDERQPAGMPNPDPRHGENPGQDRGDDRHREGQDRMDREVDPRLPDPDPTYEPKRPFLESDAHSDVDGAELRADMNPDLTGHEGEAESEAGVRQNAENDALYSQNDYAQYSRRLDEFDQGLTSDSGNPNDPENFRERSQGLRSRLEEAKEAGSDQWDRMKHEIKESMDDLDRSWKSWQGKDQGDAANQPNPKGPGYPADRNPR